MLNNIVEKRWFGDVNQKPIRSPSLRLRFGRRSDPNLPQMRRTAYDDLLERELTLNQQPTVGEEAELSDDYDVAFERVLRKPQRLRWGRSVLPSGLDLAGNRADKDQVRRPQERNRVFQIKLDKEETPQGCPLFFVPFLLFKSCSK